MSLKDGFLRAIIESPDDDTPRLVYADWLEDHGDPPRAEFIRLQCELAHIPEDDERRPEREARERELLARHETVWTGPLPGWVAHWEFRRGLVDRITLTPEALVAHGEEIFRHAPVRQALLLAGGDLPSELAALRHLAHLTTLEIQGIGTVIPAVIPSAVLWSLLASPHITRLNTLALRGGVLDHFGVIRLAIVLPWTSAGTKSDATGPSPWPVPPPWQG
jgi:uncharacterized protein (TIGR02996 family)